MAWCLSKRWKKLPSEIFHVGENLVGAYNLGSEIAAYTFDLAVWTFGSHVQDELDAVESKQKDPKRAQAEEKAMRARVLERWLPKVSTAEPEAKPAHMFADPATRL